MKVKNNKYIRTSSHTIKFSNIGKLKTYSKFLKEYRNVAKIFIDFIWDNEYEFINSKNNIRIFNIKTDQLNVPQFFDYNLIPIKNKTTLSARSLSSLVTQCCGIVRAATEPRKKLLFKLKKLKENNDVIPKKFFDLIEKTKLVKPTSEKTNPELSSKNIDFEEVNGKFDFFIRLKYIGEFDSICIPIKMHKQANKWKKFSNRKGSILLTDKNIQIRWEFEKPIKDTGRVVGADQGKLTVLSLSDSQTTTKQDKHGHSMDSIMKKLSIKKKGSRKFQRAQNHRTNFINWSINQLNFDGIKQLNFEKISGLRFGKSTSGLMSHFTYTEIEKKAQSFREENGVHFLSQPSAFRSQRCSECGWVHSTNRKKKEFKCMKCGAELDVDINAAINHEFELPFISEWVMKSGLNYSDGFYWKSDGFFDKDGVEFRVRLFQNKKI
jgi:predicted Zn-ribbon and HTH transcriptional regulator